MSTVFYRKWRPTRFSDVVGQEHITDTLRRAVISNRVAHAYLFTGPRGVGKTSTARILAKALNAELDKHGDPLQDTETAIAIDQGRYMDLIEIDAASNRGIDDIRALRDRVLLRPSIGQFKVYIIDEVHMLTDAAFNALLKTLEEPPPQVVMILATTDIHRVPATIISRCQRFDFRRLTPDDVIGRLSLICDEEGIVCEPEALELVARAAWGSLRDAENLLEQLAVAYGTSGTSKITQDQARELLGIGDASSARNLASAILRKDTKRALEIIEEEAERGAELKGLRDSTVSALRGALLTNHGISSIYGQLGDAPELEPEAMNAPTEQMLHAITVFGRNERFGDVSSPLTLEIATLKAVAEPPKPQHAPTTQTPQQHEQRQHTRPAPEPVTTHSPSDIPETRILEQIGKVAGQQVRNTFAQVNFVGPKNGIMILQAKYSNTEKRLRDISADESINSKLRSVFQNVYGQNIRFKLKQAATTSPTPNPDVQPATPSTSTATISSSSTTESQPENQISDQPQPFNIPDEVNSHPAVQHLRNIGGRIVSVDD